jgi:hypothetical protein
MRSVVGLSIRANWVEVLEAQRGFKGAVKVSKFARFPVTSNERPKLVEAIKGALEVTLLRVEAHQQAGESPDDALRRAELVRQGLIKRGIDAARLKATSTRDAGPRIGFVIEQRKAAHAPKKVPGQKEGED